MTRTMAVDEHDLLFQLKPVLAGIEWRRARSSQKENKAGSAI